MNDIYIDANVNNSFNVNEENSDFTYKLQEPLELPKGTQISIQQSFINKKGITGGSRRRYIRNRRIYTLYYRTSTFFTYC